MPDIDRKVYQDKAYEEQKQYLRNLRDMVNKRKNKACFLSRSIRKLSNRRSRISCISEIRNVVGNSS